MKRTRREFMRDAAVVGTVVAAGTTIKGRKTETAPIEMKNKRKCPFFDQPLMCDGPDEFGKYKCD